MDWPPQSPDLNPIENLWDAIERLIRKDTTPLASLPALEDIIHSKWLTLDLTVLQNLVESMPRRIQAVLKAKGGSSRY